MADDDVGQCRVISPASDDDRSLFVAISYGKVHRLSSILSKTDDLDVRDANYRTPLINAIFIQKDDVRAHVVRMLIRHGCDVNADDIEGRTALMYACMDEDKVDSVRLLIRSKRCDPNMQDREGYTALMHAAVSGNVPAIKVLTSHTNSKNLLSVNSVNKQGLTALELAMKLRLKEVCKVLVHEGCAEKKVKDRSTLFDILRGEGSRTNTPFANLNSPRGNFSPRLSGIQVRTSPLGRQNSDLYRRVLLSPAAEGPSPIPRRVKNTSDIYQRLLSSPSSQFPVSPREIAPLNLSNKGAFHKQNQGTSSRRPLTPITPRNSISKGSPSPVNNPIPHPQRLPSIPSGKGVRTIEDSDLRINIPND